MIRGDRSLVRRLRRGVRRAWKNVPRARRRRWKKSGGLLRRHYSLTRLRLGLPVLIFLLFAVPDVPLTPLFSCLALHGVFATLRFAASLAKELRDPGHLAFAFWLPMQDRAIFDTQTRPFRAGVFAFGCDWLAVGCGMAFWHDHAGWWAAAPLLALAQGGVAASCALFLARLRPDGRWQAIHTILAWAIGLYVLFGRHLADASLEWGLAAFDLLRRLTPFGLFANGAQIAATKNAWLFLGLAVVAVGTVGLAWRLLQRWRASYSTTFLEDAPAEASNAGLVAQDDFHPEEENENDAEEPVADAGRNATPGLREAEPRPERSAAFDNPYDREQLARELRLRLDYDPGEAYASQGPFERLLSRLWSARQRRMLPIYGPPPSRWHHRVVIAAGIVLATALGAMLVQSLAIALIGAGVGFTLLLPVWEQRWGAFWILRQGPVQSAVHGYLPISLHSLAGAHWVQAHAKILLAGALLVLGLAPWVGPREALHYGALGCCLAMTWAPLAFLLGVSAGTNDSSARWWHSLLLIVVGGVLLVGGVTLLVVAFSVDDPRVMALCCGLAIAGSNTLLLAYLWAAGRRLFDLMPIVRS